MILGQALKPLARFIGILLSPLVWVLKKIGAGFNYVFPGVDRQLIPPSLEDALARRGARVPVSYFIAPDKNWKLATSGLHHGFMVAFWTWFTIHSAVNNTYGWWALLLIPAFMINVCAPAVGAYRLAVVSYSLMLRTPVRIGDVEDVRDNMLTYRMVDSAKRFRVKLALISRNGVLRAYFRNDEEAVLIRAAS